MAENGDGYGGLSLTDKGEAILFGREPVQLRPDPEPKAPKERRRGSATDRDDSLGLSEADEALFQHLRGLRATLARQEGVAAYMIFPDRTLIEMARAKPVDLWALRSVHGVGERKRDAYGSPSWRRWRSSWRMRRSGRGERGSLGNPSTAFPHILPSDRVYRIFLYRRVRALRGALNTPAIYKHMFSS